MERRVVDTVLALNGDVYGRYLCEPDHRDIECHIDFSMFKVLINVLSIDYNVRTHTYGKNRHVAIIKSPTSTNDSMILRIDTLYRRIWLETPIQFDIYLLAQNSYSTYIRTAYKEIDAIMNKTRYIEDRIKQKTFCILDTRPPMMHSHTHGDYGHDEIKHKVTIIQQAKDLILSGWVMDDAFLGDRAWVIGRYHNFNNITSYQRVRQQSYLKIKYGLLEEQESCSICRDTFDEHDVVIHLACGHLFHVNCPNSSNMGLLHWMNQDKDTCPMCRHHI